jgi:hypothetical protein
MGCLRPWAMGPMALQLAHSEAITGRPVAGGRQGSSQAIAANGPSVAGQKTPVSKLSAFKTQACPLSASGLCLQSYAHCNPWHLQHR